LSHPKATSPRKKLFLISTNTITISINLLVQKIRVIINYQNTTKGLDASLFSNEPHI
jgi:hypothetical protein